MDFICFSRVTSPLPNKKNPIKNNYLVVEKIKKYGKIWYPTLNKILEKKIFFSTTTI